jgi:hypothetical protein
VAVVVAVAAVVAVVVAVMEVEAFGAVSWEGERHTATK